jgi:hypothetical protein
VAESVEEQPYLRLFLLAFAAPDHGVNPAKNQ